jgi:hypothetical protein
MAQVSVGELIPWKGAWWIVTHVDAEKGLVEIMIRAETEKRTKLKRKAKKRGQKRTQASGRDVDGRDRAQRNADEQRPTNEDAVHQPDPDSHADAVRDEDANATPDPHADTSATDRDTDPASEYMRRPQRHVL